MAVIGPDYRIIHADLRMNGRVSDSGNWSRNAFRKAIEDSNNPLDIPPAKPLPVRSRPISHILVGDDAFGLISYLMKPYSQTGLTEEKLIFDYRHSR